MRLASTLTAEFSFTITLLLVLTFSSNARAQSSQSGAQNASQAACSTAAGAATAQNGSTSQSNSSVSTEAKNVENAAKSLGSIFKKKSPPANSAAAAPCPPATPSTPAPGGPNANAPNTAAAPAQPDLAQPNTAPAVAASPSSAPQAPASGSALGGVQLPPAPPGGLDPSKLPDILGIHIGTPTEKVIAQLNSLYPRVRNERGTQMFGPGGYGVGADVAAPGLGFLKYAPTNDPPYVASAMYSRPFSDPCPSSPTGCQSNDEIRAIFSGPPVKVLVRLERVTAYGSGQPTTTANLKAALAQKYGPSFTEDPPLTLNWAFDEQGKALPAPPKPISCRGIISQQGTLIPLTSYLGISPTTAPQIQQQQLTTLMRGRCSYIFVQARINGQPNGPANELTVIIQELPEDVRDAFAAEAYMQQAAKAQSNQQLNNAQQQAAPKF
jgi:hypothetical protein